MNDGMTDIHAVLDFAQRAVGRLGHFSAHFAAIDKQLQPDQVLDKFVAETALLLLLAARLPRSAGLAARVGGMAQALARFARQPRHLQLLASNPQCIVGVGFSHILLNRLGARDGMFGAAVDAAFGSAFTDSVDRPNFRQMEMQWLRALHTGAAPDFTSLLPCSLLNKPLHPIYMRRADAYAVTHAAMYLSDFGAQALDSHADPAAMLSFVEHGLSWCLAYADWDLLAEILIVHVLSGAPASPFARLADSVLRRVYATHAAVPGPNFDSKAFEALDGTSSDVYFAMHTYHSTYVYGILRILELLAAPAPAIIPSAGRAIGERHEARDWPLAPWLMRMEPAEREAGAEVLSNARLIYLAREGKYAPLFAAIERGEACGSQRLGESSSVASELLMQAIRAEAFRAATT